MQDSPPGRRLRARPDGPVRGVAACTEPMRKPVLIRPVDPTRTVQGATRCADPPPARPAARSRGPGAACTSTRSWQGCRGTCAAPVTPRQNTPRAAAFSGASSAAEPAPGPRHCGPKPRIAIGGVITLGCPGARIVPRAVALGGAISVTRVEDAGDSPGSCRSPGAARPDIDLERTPREHTGDRRRPPRDQPASHG